MRNLLLRLFCTGLLATLLSACGGGSDPGPSAALATASKAALAQDFTGNRSQWRIERGTTGHTLTHSGSGQTRFVPFTSNVGSLVFDDVTVNLSIADKSRTIAAADLKMLQELYVAFFNRVPDADGLAFWIEQFRLGMDLDTIAQSFYTAGLQYPDLTGYTGSMSNEDFVRVIYRNVLGRSGATAPPAEDVAFWAGELASGRATKGSLIRTMLMSAHTFANHATWGWVPQLLDNKVAVASAFAVANGLNFRTPQQSIQQTLAMVAAVTPASAEAALATVAALGEPSFDLRNAPMAAPESYAGRYTGTYSGGDNGTFDVTVDSAGNINGTASSPTLDPTVITGYVEPGTGGTSMSVGGTARQSIFSGVVDVATGVVSGTWSDPEGLRGTFSGSR